MSTYRTLRQAVGCATIIAATALLAGCHQSGEAHTSKAMFPHTDGDPIVRADTFPMGQADRFDQPYPEAPLFGKTDYLREKDVWPVALADIHEPLPPGVPLPARQQNIDVIEPQASTAQPSEEQGGSAPAAGWSQGITNAQGDGESNKLDAGSSK
jgi:hypothetical protein